MKDNTCIQVLLPAYITNQEQQEMTDRARKSIVSFEHCVKIIEDNNKYKYKVAEVWETFFNNFRGKEYDCLMIMANDVELDCNAIDYAIKCLESHKEAGVITFHVTRDYDEFKREYGQKVYNGRLTQSYSQMDPACFILKKGVIEKVGKIDYMFPCEFVERDYWYRCELAGYKWIELEETLCFHPSISSTIGNDDERLRTALRKYVLKWGGDAGQEVYKHPYNNLSYSYKDGTKNI